MRVMIVDDHFVVRSGLVASLEMEEGITVVAEAEDGESALELFREEVPDVVLMDLQLPGWNRNDGAASGGGAPRSGPHILDLCAGRRDSGCARSGGTGVFAEDGQSR